MQEIEKPNHQYYAVVAIASAVVFKLYSVFIQRYGPTPEVIKKNGKVVRWFNIFVSVTHSAVAAVGSLYCFYVDPDLASKIINPHTLPAYTVTCISLGYFVHDLIQAIRQQHISTGWEIILHHLVVIFCFGIAVFQQRFINYAIVSLLCEVNSLFLHVRQLMNMARIPSSTSIYRVNSLINIVTYVIFRICVLAWMVRWLVLHKNSLQPVIHVIAVIGMCVMTVINSVLFARLLSKDYWNRVGSSNLDGLKAKKTT